MQATTTKILDERRFPVSLTETITPIRELYDCGKQERWNPEVDILWKTLDLGKYDADILEAARLTWSRRAWVEYAGLCETPALLVRLCLELGREADPKYFLTVRNTEEAWQIDCYHRYAQALGGYVDSSPLAATEKIFNQYRHRHVLDAEQNVDVLFAVYSVAEDGLELALFEAYLAGTTEPVAKQILTKSVKAKQRNVSFAWLYMTKRAAQWSPEQCVAVGSGVHSYLQDIELNGYHCAWLGDPQGQEAQAADITAKAGLGAVTQATEAVVFKTYITQLREDLRNIGIPLAELTHPELGTL
ncbi:MAG: hypothetical protein KA735_04290 [Burkholderiaceae bacterium]|nr:hypothetical protein [Burkholderiaceae bacterium]